MIRSFNVVVATTKNYGIGRKGNLPWSPLKLRDDMNFFRKLTCET